MTTRLWEANGGSLECPGQAAGPREAAGSETVEEGGCGGQQCGELVQADTGVFRTPVGHPRGCPRGRWRRPWDREIPGMNTEVKCAPHLCCGLKACPPSPAGP